MTTSTNKHVTRITGHAYGGRILGAKPRRIVITIAGDTLVMRQERCRQREYLNIRDAFELAKWARVKAERMTAINAKRRNRKP